MKKILLVATVQSHIAQFHRPLIQLLKENGCEVHVAARDNLEEKNGLTIVGADKIFNIPFSRSPINKRNITAYKQLKKLLERERYDVIHCNTPVGGVVGRLAAKKWRKKGLKVFYTAHGFHFYKGASKLNWLVYYPLEKMLARITDKLITICEEDYLLASKKFKTEVCRIHGVGVDSERYHPIPDEDKKELKEKLGFSENDKLILCVGELLPNKNQKMAIRAMSEIVKQIPTAILLLAGNGPTLDELKAEVENLGLSKNVRFMGYVTNLEKYQQIADLSVSCSKREGLGLNLIEAMLTGNPVVATKNRGHCELVRDRENGFLVEMDDYVNFSNHVIDLLKDTNKRAELGSLGWNISQKYKSHEVIVEIKSIYSYM